jgi:hypothetical protein
MAAETSTCPNCQEQFQYERYHSGFGNEGYLYCDSDSTVATWNTYDPEYVALVGDIHPWMLSESSKHKVERSIMDCPSGGHFRFNAKPRCPNCLFEMPELATDPIYFVTTGKRISGDVQRIWKDSTL